MIDSVVGGALGSKVGKAGGLFGKKKKKKKKKMKARPPQEDQRLKEIALNQTLQTFMMNQILRNQQAIMANQKALGGMIQGQSAMTAQRMTGAGVLGNVAALNAMFSPCTCPEHFLGTLSRLLSALSGDAQCSSR